MNGLKQKFQKIPADLISLDDYERYAADFVEASALSYIAGGSGSEASLRANHESFRDISLYNRVLMDCGKGSTGLRLLGQDLRHPILLAPVAYQKLVHPQGEHATASGAAAADALMVLSTLSTVELEAVSAATAAPKWFQLYFQARRADTLSLIRRAEAAGFGALVVTLDAALQMPSRAAQRIGFRLPPGLEAVNLKEQWQAEQMELPRSASVIFQGMMREAPTWSDIEWLLGETRLPVIAKGILHTDDATRLVRLGVKGIVVSNHGGRALDGAVAPLRALPAVRRALGKETTILLDGAVRSGADVLKALALGADAVMIGRPQLYALAVAGGLGVAHMIKLLRDELEVAMALAGCPTLAEIDGDILFGARSPGSESGPPC